MDDQFERFPNRPLPPSPALDRFGAALSGDCEACGMLLGGTAEVRIAPAISPARTSL